MPRTIRALSVGTLVAFAGIVPAACSSSSATPGSETDASTSPSGTTTGTTRPTEPPKNDAGPAEDAGAPEDAAVEEDSSTPDATTGPNLPVTLVTSSVRIVRLALGGSEIFYTTNDSGNYTVRAIPLAGGAPRTVVSGSGGSRSLVVAGGFVYFNDGQSDTVRRVPVAGGASTTIGSPGGDIALDATDVYYSDYRVPAIYRVPLAGGTRETILADRGGGGLALVGSNLYWTTGATFEKADKSGANPVVLSNFIQIPTDFVIAGSDALVVDAIRVRQVSLTGGSSGTLFQGVSGRTPLALDGTKLVFADDQSRLATSAIAVNAPPTPLTPKPTDSVEFAEIVVDATGYFYAVNSTFGSGGSLMKLAK